MIAGFRRQGAFRFEKWVEKSGGQDCLWIFKTYWKRIIFLTLIGLGLGFAFNRWSPPLYVSEATVRFIPPQVADKYVTPNVAMQVEQRIFAVTQLVNSRLTATKMIETFNLYPQRRRFLTIQDLVPKFQSDLRLRTVVSQEGDRNRIPSIVISYYYADAERAQKVVQRVVELIYEENRRYRSDQSIGTTDFLGQELKTVLEQMTTLEAKMKSVQTTGGEDKEYRNIIKVGQLHDLNRRLVDLQHSIHNITADRDQRKSAVEGYEAHLRSQMAALERRPPVYSPTLEGARHQLEAARTRVDELRQRYRPGHSDLILAENVLRRAEETMVRVEESERKMEVDRATSDVRVTLTKARNELAGFDETLERLSKEEKQLIQELEAARKLFVPQPDSEVDRMAVIRDYQSLKDHYGELIKKQRQSELASDMERRGHGETVELVEPPTLPLRAELPTREMVIGAGGMVGMILGYMLGMLSFFRLPRLRTTAHLEMLGNYPVLACLPGGSPLRPETNSKKALDVLGAPATFVLTLVMAVGLSGCASPEDEKQSLLKKGNAAAAVGDWKTATIHYRKAIQIDGRFGQAHQALGEAYLRSGYLVQAREELLRAAEIMPDEYEAQSRLGDLTYQIYFADPGRPATLLREMEESATKLIQKWPNKPTGYRLRAQVLLERHENAKAVEIMEQALERMEDGAVRTQLAAAYYSSGDIAKAEKHLRAAIAADPKYSPGFDLLYLQKMDRGETDLARAVLAEKMQRQGTLDAALQLAAHDDAVGRRDDVEPRLAVLAKQFQKDHLTYAKIGDFWFHRGEYDKANLWYGAGQSAHPSNRTLFSGRLAEILMARQDIAGARALIAKELDANPKDPLMRAYQAAFELDGNSVTDRKQAQAKLESVLMHMPNSPFVRLHLGRAYLLNGDFVRASDQLQQAVTLDPNYAPGWLALAEAELLAGTTSAAEERLNALLKRAPGYTPARLLQAQASLVRNRPIEAQKTLEALLQVDPGNTEAMLVLAKAKASLSQRAEAFGLIERFQKLRPDDPRALLLQARIELDAGNRKGALDRLRQAPPAQRDNPEVAGMAASIALMVGDDKLALANFEKLAKSHPDNLQYRLGLASSLAMVGRRADAEKEYKAVQEKGGADPRPWLLYGALMAQAGNSLQARTAYQEALKRDRQNPYALNNLAFLLARSGEDLQKALSMAEEAKRGLPGSTEIQDTLAYVYLRLGMKRNAVAVLEEMLPRQPASEQHKTKKAIEQIQRGELSAVQAEMESAAKTLD